MGTYLRSLQAGSARVEVAAEHGCLITALDTGFGDVLWRDGRAARCLRATGLRGDDSAQEFDDDILIGGWFPMFPSAGLPDADTQLHGWAPRVPWAVTSHEATSLVCSARGPFLDGGSAHLERSIRLGSTSLDVRTRITNAGAGSRRFTFGEHPCLSRRLFAGGRTGLDGVTEVRIPSTASGEVGHIRRQGRVAEILAGEADLRVAISDAAGTLPHWVLWRNYRADDLPRADTFAWEPSTAPGLGIADARASDDLVTIEPGGVFTAHVRCEWNIVDNQHRRGRLTG